ncbi:MAG: hypothetical protein ACLRRT_09865 [Ruthenibacterium lactatiformans]
MAIYTPCGISNATFHHLCGYGGLHASAYCLRRAQRAKFRAAQQRNTIHQPLIGGQCGLQGQTTISRSTRTIWCARAIR